LNGREYETGNDAYDDEDDDRLDERESAPTTPRAWEAISI
jgi:hypothetical protein